MLLLDLVRHCDPARYRHAVCCLGEDGPLRQAFEGCAVPIYVLGKRNTSEMARIVLKGRNVARSWAPDIIHIHRNGPDVWGQTIALAAGARHVVVTEHSTYTAEPNRLRGAIGILRTSLRRVLRRQIGMTVAISEAVRQEILRYHMVTPSTVTVIYNGVDTNTFSPATPSPQRKHPVLVGAAGRMVRLKGFDIFIRAAKRIVEEGHSVRFLLAGKGEEERTLRRLVSDSGLQPRFEFVGERSDMPAFLRQLDIFVFPSLREGFGLSLVEAMSCGLPCIGADVDGVREIIDSGRNGLLVSAGNPDAIAIALSRYLEDREFACRMGEAARCTAVRRFRIEDMTRQYEQVYTGLLRS